MLLKYRYDYLIIIEKRINGMIADKIKMLRTSKNLTQTQLAKRLGITRSGVNSWEMGISVPSTINIVELSHVFGVSTDYLLGIEHEAVLDISGLDDECVQILNDLVQYMKSTTKH